MGQQWVLNEKKKLDKMKGTHLEGENRAILFFQVAFDIMGALPKASAFRYILHTGHQFSKWYKAVPMQNQENKTVAKVFVES